MRGFIFFKKIYFVIIILFVSNLIFARNSIDNFKVWRIDEQDTIRITLDFAEKPEMKEIPSGNQTIIVLNFNNSIYRKNSDTYRVKNYEVDYFRLAQFDRNNVRLVGKFDSKFEYKTYVMQKNSELPYRMVIDFYARENSVTENMLFPTVVVDPGHGGRDPGAVGNNKTKEKAIVLDIAKHLEKKLWQTGKVNPVLTREEDVYVGLKERVKVTENKGAVLFISIHNNAEPTGRARGYRVYILNDSGKVDKAAEMLASRENDAFEIFDESKNKVNDLNVLGILYDLKINQTISESSKFAHIVLNTFQRDFKDVDSQVRRAPFAVLKHAGIPSVLVECGFLSNKTDERMLNNVFYREKVAESIKEAVLTYLDEKKLIAYELENIVLPNFYEIKPGDTLSTIAHRFKIDVESLKKINNIHDPSRIYAGTKIKINN